MSKILLLEKPEYFNFKITVQSHGWSDLLPFKLDAENLRLSYVFQDKSNKQPIAVTIYESDKKLVVEICSDEINRQNEKQILSLVRHILRIDEDLSEFYQMVKSEENLAWIARDQAGRLLRSQTVFEDLIKTVCTTNCSWALTRNMVTNLVEKLGEPAETGERAFPSAEALAGVAPEFYREEIRAGYRAPYFSEIAEQVASGKINPESWLDSDVPTAELKKEIKKIKGVGDYAAENLLKLVGRYDGLALDSFLRGGFYKKHNQEINCTDDEIRQFYKRFGIWRGLAMWCDMTERWHQNDD